MIAIPHTSDRGAASGRTLRRLFLTLFLRGRSARGLSRTRAPGSIARKLLVSLAVYALFGLMALLLRGQPVFAIAVYLHAMTFVFISMYVASSAGEVLFNREEADILLHRPIEPRSLLWAKVSVLVQVSLWLAAAFNVTGLFVGAVSSRSWVFPLVHALSTALSVLFCVGFVVLTYQLCLRWFGRDRLERFMTWVQVLVSVGFVAAAQIVPRALTQAGRVLEIRTEAWWLALVPPGWFAGLDDLLAGSRTPHAWFLAIIAVSATALVAWAAFGKLARGYLAGLQNLTETAAPAPARRQRRGRRFADVLASKPPFSWWLRDPAERGAFVLSVAYLFRDRDVKLRIYPALAPALIVPIVFLLQNRGNSTFFMAFAGTFVGMTPMTALRLLRYSQQWEASDLFRVAPIPGPAAMCHGARRAVLCFIALPLLVAFAAISVALSGLGAQQLLFLPGAITLPLYSLIPCLDGDAVPLSHPIEEARAASRGLVMIAAMLSSAALAGIATAAWTMGWFWQFLLAESVAVAALYAWLRGRMSNLAWQPIA